jgi:hypothetical protein
LRPKASQWARLAEQLKKARPALVLQLQALPILRILQGWQPLRI